MGTDCAPGGFTRQETLTLTGCTSSRLAYLEKVGLIIPHRIGNNKRPLVLFTWEQLLEIRAIKNLRKDVSLQTVRNIISFLDESGFDSTLKDKMMVVIDEEVFWVQPDLSDIGQRLPKAVKVAAKRNKGIGQYILVTIPPFSAILGEIWHAARESSAVVDFESFKGRAKAEPA